MTRFSARITTVLAVLTLGASVAAVNCSRGGDTSTGTVRLALSLPNGTTLNSVSWTILSSMGATLRSGTINTSDPAATPSVDTSCPASTGDTVQMTGTTSDGTSCTGTSAPFNVTAGGTTMVGLTIVCGGGVPVQNNGSVIVNGTVVVGDNCPLLTSWVASPLVSSTSGQIDVSATATDADAADVLTYSWTATGGSFVMPASATTKYNCTAPGPQTLTITVSDNHQPSPCTTFITMPVTCVALQCGNGVLDPGEQCDPTAPTDPNRTHCSANCTLLPFCGDGHIDPGEQCDPPTAGKCSATCQFAPVCGDGIIAGPPFGTETCDPPGPLPGGATCDAQCHTVTPEFDCNASCQSCEQNSLNCDPTLTSVPSATAFGCAGFTGTLHTNCIALINCIRRNNCAVGDDPTACLCGAGVDPVACATGAVTPSGACVTQYNAALAGGPPGTPFTLFTDPRSPIGISDNLWTCQVDGPCSTQCAFATCVPPQGPTGP
jgi:hypothetical protein